MVICLAIAALSQAPRSDAQESRPFRSTNLAPPVAIFGLPIWADVPEGAVFGLTAEIANHYRLSRRGDERLILDGETHRLRLYYERPFDGDWSVAFDLPLLRQSGGFLDNVVDAWHSTFRLPDGGRDFRPEDQLEFMLADGAGDFFVLDEPSTGPGDLQLSVARRFGGGEGVVVRGAIKLATGDEEILAGSGATDWSLGVFRQREGTVRDRAAGYYYGLAVLDPGRPDLVRYPIEDLSWNGVLGGALSIGERIGIKGQLEVYTPLYDTLLEELGQTAVQATLGGWLRFGDGTLFEFGVSEDLHVSTAPDVALFFGLQWNRR
jgi:hypothetical protein